MTVFSTFNSYLISIQLHLIFGLIGVDNHFHGVEASNIVIVLWAVLSSSSSDGHLQLPLEKVVLLKEMCAEWQDKNGTTMVEGIKRGLKYLHYRKTQWKMRCKSPVLVAINIIRHQ